MPVKKVGNKWEVNGEEYDSEAKANAAYQATIALKFDVPVKKTKKKKAKKESDEEEESEEE